MSNPWVALGSFPGSPAHLMRPEGGATLCGIRYGHRSPFVARPDNQPCFYCQQGVSAPHANSTPVMADNPTAALLEHCRKHGVQPTANLQRLIQMLEDLDA